MTTWDENLNMQTGMAYHEFIELVGLCRRRQNAYFKSQRTVDLIRSKEIEAKVDAVVEKYMQGRLFTE